MGYKLEKNAPPLEIGIEMSFKKKLSKGSGYLSLISLKVFQATSYLQIENVIEPIGIILRQLSNDYIMCEVRISSLKW